MLVGYVNLPSCSVALRQGLPNLALPLQDLQQSFISSCLQLSFEQGPGASGGFSSERREVRLFILFELI